MRIMSVRHRGLRRLMQADDTAGLPVAVVPKLRAIPTFLQDMSSEAELSTVPGWRAHKLTGDRKGVWALHVTRNWRLTFRIDDAGVEIVDLDYEDYH
jgi:proteic killer suppression protein